MSIAIVIVNYRTGTLTVDCLRSLAADGWLPAEGRVLVVDNASGDDSVQLIAQAVADGGWQNWVQVITAERNGGFAFGNNLGIRRALEAPDKPRYILLLNPDTVVRLGAIESLVRFMDANERVGIAGSRLENPDGTPRISAFRFPTVLSELENGLRLGLASRLLARWLVAPPVMQTAHEADWVAGASMIVRQEVLENVGLMDEDYFLYYEEVDYCLQARRKGWPCWYVPESRVVHLVGQSTGVTASDARVRRRPAYWFSSRTRYFRKNHGWCYLMAANAAWLGGASLWRLRQILTGKTNPDPPRLRRDFLLHSFVR